ncbi:hypothetical protein FB566_0693 [Stackebrandtia endophytica]|uniref:Uncharacterized protein n=1 Tax=Stackebrandtia endophytica TaxID=1496996 RepID=A0A543ARN4_9ACTN|nr:hypothetical protein FB566_0693 [Stackebrandtia endophytica]
MYRSLVASTIRSGICGAGSVLSHPLEAAQSRTNCLSNDGWAPPGRQPSIGQKRDESEVNSSSANTSRPAESVPNSTFVSAMMMPRSAANAAPRRYSLNVRSRNCSAVSAPNRSTTPWKLIGSSCSPTGALVEGVKTGSGNRSPSRSPGGNATPDTAPSRR